jgi:hypothetical protein
MRWKSLAALFSVLLAAPLAPAQAQFCLAQVSPIPAGPAGRPAEAFNVPGDYYWAHSGTHLQGTPATEKWAWAFYTPMGAPFAGFRTAVIVDNPSATAAVTVRIEYRDTAGNPLLPWNTVTIAPQCFYTEQATPIATGNGFGSVRVVSTDGHTFVGATEHHSYTFAGAVDPDFLSPGLASMQQLQVVQASATTLFGGPFPVTTVGAGGAPLDPYAFNVGNIPVFQVVNPNNAVNTLTVSLSSPQLGGVFSVNTVTLPPFGSYLDMTLFNAVIPIYTTVPPPPLNIDVVATITSNDGLPILGEQLMLDFFDQFMTLLARFRMGSAELEHTPALTALNPELTFTVGGPPVHTLMAIANVTGQDIGPVGIQYISQGGAVIGNDSLATFPAGATQRIAPGEPGIIGYPVGVWDFTVRITACLPGLIGWTMREVEPDPNVLHFHKAYGETLMNTTGAEPGKSIRVTTLGQTLARKVSPIERIASTTSFPNWWPGYNAIANYSVANINNYWFRSFRRIGGGACAETTSFAPQPFAGLPFSQASFTFKDGVAQPLALPPFPTEHMGTVDHQTGSVIGIDVIGDPLREWGLGFPSGPTPEETQPGDVFVPRKDEE